MIRIREAREGDAGYVMATALRQVPRVVRSRSRPLLEDAIRAVVYSSRVVVACAEEDDDALCGWAAGMHCALLFAFVPRELRGNGIGRRLIEAIHANSSDPRRLRTPQPAEPVSHRAGGRDVPSARGADS